MTDADAHSPIPLLRKHNPVRSLDFLFRRLVTFRGKPDSVGGALCEIYGINDDHDALRRRMQQLEWLPDKAVKAVEYACGDAGAAKIALGGAMNNATSFFQGFNQETQAGKLSERIDATTLQTLFTCALLVDVKMEPRSSQVKDILIALEELRSEATAANISDDFRKFVLDTSEELEIAAVQYCSDTEDRDVIAAAAWRMSEKAKEEDLSDTERSLLKKLREQARNAMVTATLKKAASEALDKAGELLTDVKELMPTFLP